MEKLSIQRLVLEAWASTLAKKKLPWIFGSLVALSGLIGSQINSDFTNIASLEDLVSTITQKPPRELLFLFFIIFVLFIIGTLGKSNLIVSLSFVVDKHDLSNHPTTPQAIGKNFIRSFILECLAFLFLIVIAGILSLPVLIASHTNPEAMHALINFGFLTLIPIVIIIFLIKQFALFYLLLSPLSIRAAVETGSFLFSRFIPRSLLFISFSFILSLLFTFCMNLVILGIVVLLEKTILLSGTTILPFFLSFVFFTWFVLFEQALWLAFFKSIGSQKESNAVLAEKESLIENDVLPDIPPAQ